MGHIELINRLKEKDQKALGRLMSLLTGFYW